VPRLGWAGLRNGDLLRRANPEFDAFISGDRSLEYQQNLSDVQLRIVIVVAPDNRVETITALAPRILAALDSTQPGQVARVAG